jgi:hypothetical protein
MVPCLITSLNHQVIHVDVSQQMECIRTPFRSTQSEPFALLNNKSTFSLFNKIGAGSGWLAYAMTKGLSFCTPCKPALSHSSPARVRVINTNDGNHTLLRLPDVFSPASSVVALAISGNRLAGVTSDGGFVVWELPLVIINDVPGKLLLSVVPPPKPEALKSARWHPKQPDTVTVASESKIYLIDVAKAFRRFGGNAVNQNELNEVGLVIMSSSVSARVTPNQKANLTTEAARCICI